MSAAAFIKGLLDLEGSSLTPILVSLVTKNASMLDAFGKVRTARDTGPGRLLFARTVSMERLGPVL
jgi:hypothetical protein